MENTFFGNLMPKINQRYVGFDNFFDEVTKALNTGLTFPKYPPYNIIKVSDTEYQVELAVAGFSNDNLSIEVINGQLVVEGKIEDKQDTYTTGYMYRGIATRSFTRSFDLAADMVVDTAKLNNGLLTIKLVKIVPEKKNPIKIEVK